MLQDVRYAVRTLVGSPAFTGVALLSLALGIGANTAIFTIVNAILLRPIPVASPATLVSVSTTDQRNPGNLPLSHLNFKDLRDANEVFTDMAAVAFAQANWNSAAGAEPIPVQLVSGNYFDLLGVVPRLGRGFTAAEDSQPTPVAVVSDGFWRRSLESNPGILGKPLTINRTAFTVVGVAPPGFTGTTLGDGPSVWVPMSTHAIVQPGFAWYETRRGLFLFAFGRLKQGVRLEQARANLATVFARLEQAFPVDNKGRSAVAVPLLEARLNPNGAAGAPVVQISLVLMVVVGIVLLIACANVANLLLARATRRRREIAIRLALGAGRTRLIRQLMTESLLLSSVGTALGVALAWWMLRLLIGADLDLPIPVNETVTLDGRVLLFAAALAVVTGLVFGLVPAIQGSRPDVVPVLKNESVPAATGPRGALRFLRGRHVLVAVQVALSLVSLVAAGLFLKSFRASQDADPGFSTQNVLVIPVNLGREGYTPERGQLFYTMATERLAAVPGVHRAAVAQNAPLGGGILRSVFPEGADTTTTDRLLVQVNAVSPGYLDTIGVPLIRGRDFSTTDAAGAPRVVIVNETMARRFWPGEDAIGKRFKFFGEADHTTVIGVARDAKYNGVAEDPIPFIYQALRQNYTPAAVLHIRTTSDAASLAPAARAAVLDIDPALAIFNVRTLGDQVTDSLAPVRTTAFLLAAFGVLALVLASVGLYGVMNYSVTQRTREIGVRMALGAARGAVLRLVLTQVAILLGTGLLLGAAVAAMLSSMVPPALLPNVAPRDPLTFAITSALLCAVALLASYVPARRATRIDPLIALRTD